MSTHVSCNVDARTYPPSISPFVVSLYRTHMLGETSHYAHVKCLRPFLQEDQQQQGQQGKKLEGASASSSSSSKSPLSKSSKSSSKPATSKKNNKGAAADMVIETAVFGVTSNFGCPACTEIFRRCGIGKTTTTTTTTHSPAAVPSSLASSSSSSSLSSVSSAPERPLVSRCGLFATVPSSKVVAARNWVLERPKLEKCLVFS